MREYYVNYRSITKAQKALRALERRGIHATLLRTPRRMQSEGCGYSLRLSEATYARAGLLPEGASSVYCKQGERIEAVWP